MDIEAGLTTAAFLEIVDNESRRLLLVPPEHLDRARWLVEQNGADQYVQVQTSLVLPEGSWLLIDPQATDAGFREALYRGLP